MSDMYKQIKQDTSKLVDINSVLTKLNNKGYINQLSNQIENIFIDEQAFTINELTRLMKNMAKDKYFDMKMQFKMNTQIFKSNFDVIMQILINNIWNKVTNDYLSSIEGGNNNNNENYEQPQPSQKVQQQQNQQQQQDQQEQLIQDTYQKEMEQQQQSLQQQQLQQMQKNSQEKAYTSQNAKNSSSNIDNNNTASNNNNNNTQSLRYKNQSSISSYNNKSFNNNTNKKQSTTQYNDVNNNSYLGQHNESWVLKKLRSDREKGNNSQNQSAIDLYDGRRSQVLRNNNVSVSQISNKQKKLQNTSKMSISSVRSTGNLSKIGGVPVPFSEISQIHDQSNFRSQSPNLNNTSFSRAPRDLDKTNYETSPGPNHYDLNKSLNHIRKASPQTKFGKSERISWIDERLRYDSSVQTPGAKYEPVKTGTSKKTKKYVSQRQN